LCATSASVRRLARGMIDDLLGTGLRPPVLVAAAATDHREPAEHGSRQNLKREY
jgi:hypothetical protein